MQQDKKTEKKGVIYGKDVVGEAREKSAIALEYDAGDVAPKVVASGKGYLAEKIINTAQENDVPIHQDKSLAKSLEQLEIGEYIPKELYQVVAEILVYVDAMDKIKGKVMEQKKPKK